MRRGFGGGLGLSFAASGGISVASSDPADCASLERSSSYILKSGLFKEDARRLDRRFLCLCLRLSEVNEERDDDCL